jgi:short/branched chain acyl-CoA dehydrogenase
VTKGEPLDISDIPPTPISHMSETEVMMAEAVSKFAQEVILPKVRDMDEAEAMDPTVVEQMFEQGLMGIEIPEEYGGAGMNFTAAIVAIEELARVDPSVSVMCDVHNTLVNTAVLKYGSEETKRKWLPRLATDTVGTTLPLHVLPLPAYCARLLPLPSTDARLDFGRSHNDKVVDWRYLAQPLTSCRLLLSL